jgi:hypothetical protein
VVSGPLVFKPLGSLLFPLPKLLQRAQMGEALAEALAETCLDDGISPLDLLRAPLASKKAIRLDDTLPDQLCCRARLPTALGQRLQLYRWPTRLMGGAKRAHEDLA